MFIPLREDAPRGRFPYATAALVNVIFVVFLVQQVIGSAANTALLYAGGAVPYEILHLTDLTGGAHVRDIMPPPLTVFSSLFLHGGWQHVIGNAWFLWLFGDNVESALGSLRFLVLYFVVGVLAVLAQVAATPGSTMPVVGASGAVAGLLGAYFVLFPRARVEVLLVLVVVIQLAVVPAPAVLAGWLLWQLIANLGDPSVALWAHLSGFLAGALLAKLLARRWSPAPASLSSPR